MQGLLQELPAIAPGHQYFLYSNKPFDAPPAGDHFVHRIESALGRCPGALWLWGRAGTLARRDSVDVFWATNPILPAKLPANVMKVVTVYDMVWLRCPETTSRYNLIVQHMWSKKAIRDADYIIVISRSTRDELVRLLGVPEEKIKLVYPGVGTEYKPHDPAAAARYIAGKYGTPERYLATVGIVHPRKNHEFLVQVLKALKDRGRLDCPLLVVGPIGWKNSNLYRAIRSAGLTDKEIRFLGFMPSEDMPLFYAGAQAFLFPTLYEGFGLPPVEAMACGTPVISSDAPAMPEVLGDAAILHSLASAEPFADSVHAVLTSAELRQTLRENGIRRAAMYSYENSAKDLAKIFELNATLRAARVPKEMSATYV